MAESNDPDEFRNPSTAEGHREDADDGHAPIAVGSAAVPLRPWTPSEDRNRLTEPLPRRPRGRHEAPPAPAPPAATPAAAAQAVSPAVPHAVSPAVPGPQRVLEPVLDEGPLWTTEDPTAPDDGWLLSRPAPAERAARRTRDPRRPVVALPTLVVLAMLAAFFGWVSAEPLRLALGHPHHGTATVTHCTGSGITERCVGDVTAPGFAAEGVALRGLAHHERGAGVRVPVLMASPTSGRAYVGVDVSPGLHLRWAVGLLLTLLCGLGIAWSTGARRLPTPRARRTALILSLAAPLALAATFLSQSP